MTKLSKKKQSKDKINTYIRTQSGMDTLRFITCGSVDDGKSTLIGRMLYESQMIFDDQVRNLQNESKKRGFLNNEINFALLFDGLEAEREQGITIDVAYRYFSTAGRRFIVADTPGHEQYTRNMVTGASKADLAIILIDARKGILNQTRRHSLICSLLGIKHIILAINKMDLLNYDEVIYKNIVEDYVMISKTLSFHNIVPIPVSALKGSNIVKRSNETPWYKGPTLLGHLESVDIRIFKPNSPFRFPVQLVNRPHLDFRGYSGTIEAGVVKKGQLISVLPSGEKAKIKDIFLYKKSLSSAEVGQSVTIVMDREIDISRGDIIVPFDLPCEISDQFQAKIIWMDKDFGYLGRSYLMKIGTQTIIVQITKIKYKIDIISFEQHAASNLELNNLYVLNLKTNKFVPFDEFKVSKSLGGFVLIDRISNKTLAAGMIDFGLQRARNIHQYQMSIDKKSRRYLNGHSSKVLWLTGLSGSGKSSIANLLEQTLHKQGVRTYTLDGDNVRHGLNRDLGFSISDRVENIRRISEVAKLMVDAGIVVITAFISPFRNERQIAREMFETNEFLEIYISTSLQVAEARDPKGLYKKARKGELKNFTGIDSPYEAPEAPEILVDTENFSIKECAKYILSKIDL